VITVPTGAGEVVDGSSTTDIADAKQGTAPVMTRAFQYRIPLDLLETAIPSDGCTKNQDGCNNHAVTARGTR
jgi:hypothetical protein